MAWLPSGNSKREKCIDQKNLGKISRVSNKTETKTNNSTVTYRDLLDPKFWFLFFIFMAIAGTALWLVYGNAYSYNAQRLSNLSSTLGNIVGLPIALAGSLVAIILGRRAYEIAFQQQEFVQIARAETLAESASENFWNLGRAINDFEDSVFTLFSYIDRADEVRTWSNSERLTSRKLEGLISTFKKQRVLLNEKLVGGLLIRCTSEPDKRDIEQFLDRMLEQHLEYEIRRFGDGIDLVRELNQLNESSGAKGLNYLSSEAEDLIGNLRSSLSRLSDCIYNTLRNPFCRAAWQHAKEENFFDISSLIPDWERRQLGGRLHRGAQAKDTMERDPRAIAQYIKAVSTRVTFDTATGVLNDTKILTSAERRRIKWSAEDGCWNVQKSIPIYKRAESKKSFEVIKMSGREAYKFTTSSSPIQRGPLTISELGACLGMDRFSDEEPAKDKELLFNSGAWIVTSLINFFPKNEEDVRSIVSKVMEDEFGASKTLENLIVSMLYDAGVCDCLPPRLLELSNKLLKEPRTTLAVAPKPY